MSTAFEKNNPVLSYKIPAILYAALIFFMSSLPGEELPDLSIFSFDKIVHGIEFGLFGMLLYRAFRFPAAIRHPFLWTVVAGIPYAALDEIHQRFVPGRNCDIYDFLMDSIGLVAFAALSHRLNRAKQEFPGCFRV